MVLVIVHTKKVIFRFIHLSVFIKFYSYGVNFNFFLLIRVKVRKMNFDSK